VSICVSVKVGEGLVLGADSVVVISHPDGRVLNTYGYAQKLSQIGELPIGTLNWGVSQIGARSIQSLVSEFERNLDDIIVNGEHHVEAIAEHLYVFLLERYNRQFEENGSHRPLLGMQVAGYSSDAFFPDQFAFQIPHDTSIVRIRRNRPDGSPDFGADWYGQTDAIVRMYKAYDPNFPALMAGEANMDESAVRNILQRFEYPVIFDGMPLQDAIDFVLWLINLVIGRFRFVLGAPTCGGDVDVAVIRPDEFCWVRRKSWHA